MSKEIHGAMKADGLRFGIVVSRFNSLITQELLAGAMDCLVRHGADPDEQLVAYAPGSWEIGPIAKALLGRDDIDGVIALGCVLKGSTTHNDHIAADVTRALGTLSLESGKPVTFGVLTPNSLEQALERAGAKMGNKGAEAAAAAIELANVLKQI